jgi:hypothetical protein
MVITRKSFKGRFLLILALHVNYSEGYLSIPLALKNYYSKNEQTNTTKMEPKSKMIIHK